MLATVILLAGSLAGLGCLIGAFWALWRKRLIDDLPTSKTRGVFIGLTELKGTAESDAPLISHLGGRKCVYCDWKVEEHWSRTVHETYRDSKGNVHARTRTESGWTTVAHGRELLAFYLKDDTGAVRVNPDGAKIDPIETYDRTCSRQDPLYFAKGPANEIANTTHRRRFNEVALPLHSSLYVIGQARERTDAVAAEIAFLKGSPMFLISTKAEKQISSGFKMLSWLWFCLGLLAVGGGAFASGINSKAPSALFIILALAAYLAAFLLGWVWTVYNSLVTLHHRVEQGQSQIEVELKRRNDLIPNLVATVGNYADFEKDTHLTVTMLREQLSVTPPWSPGPDPKGVVSELRVAMENYPSLKANEAFMSLQRSLSDTEERIALARDYYNGVATFYNSRLDIIPDRFAGRLARLKATRLMAAADFERANVKVIFEN